MFGMMAKPPRWPPWLITLVIHSTLLAIIINHERLVGVNGQQQQQEPEQQETTKPGSFINPITVFTIGNSTVSSTMVVGDPTTMAGPQHRQSEPAKVDEKLCQISDQSDQSDPSATGFSSNSTQAKLNVASNCRTLVKQQNHQQQNLDPQQSMVLEVFYNPNKDNNSSSSNNIRFQINSSNNQTTSPFNLTNKIISPHSLNAKTSPNGEITVINGKTVTSILYEQDHSAIQKLVNAKLAQPPTTSTLAHLPSTPPTTMMTTITKPDSASTFVVTSSTTPMPSSAATMVSTTKSTESNQKKQSILIDHHPRSGSVPAGAVHTQSDDNAHNHNYNNAHNHKYTSTNTNNNQKNNEANINNSKYEMMFNRKNVHSYLNRMTNQQQRTWALNSIQNHHKHRNPPHSQQAFGAKISGKTTSVQPGEGDIKVTPPPDPADPALGDSSTKRTTPTSTPTSTIRDKNRIDYLRQRYNKSVGKMNQTSASGATAAATTTTPTMVAATTASSNNNVDGPSSIMSNLATMMTTPDVESPVPVYFTTTKPLFRPNSHHHHHKDRHQHHHGQHHRNRLPHQQKIKQKFVVQPQNGGDSELNDGEIDEILLLNSTTSKPIMDIQRLRPVKPLRPSSSSSSSLPHPPPPKPQKQQSMVPPPPPPAVVGRPEIKWRPYYHRTKNSTGGGDQQLFIPATNTTSTSLTPPPSTTPVPVMVKQPPSLAPPPTMVNLTVDKEEEKTMMFLPIKTGGHHVKQPHPIPTRHRPQLTEPYEYPLMNFEDEMLHLHHPPLLKASGGGGGGSGAWPTFFQNQLAISAEGGADKKSASSNHAAAVQQDSMIPGGLGLDQHHPLFPEKNNMLMSELFDRKFNLINEIYRKKSNDPNMVVQPPLVRTSADLIRLAAQKPSPMGASSSSSSSSLSSLANKIQQQQQPKQQNLLGTTTLAGGTVAPPMAVAKPTSGAATTPMPPPEVYVTIENKFYVLRNNTATVHHPIQDLNTVDDKGDIVPSLSLSSSPSGTPMSSSSGTPTMQQPSISIVSSSQHHQAASKSLPQTSSSFNPPRFNPLEVGQFFSSQRIPVANGQGQEKIHHHQQQQQQPLRHQSQHHPATEEFPETLMQFMQKYHHQPHTTNGLVLPRAPPPLLPSQNSMMSTIDGESGGKKHHQQQPPQPPSLLSAGAGTISGQYPYIPSMYGNNRRPLPAAPSRMNKFNNLLLNDHHGTLLSESISGGMVPAQPQQQPSNVLDSTSFNHRHRMLQQQQHLDHGGDSSNNNNNPYTLVRHYIQTYFPDKAEMSVSAHDTHPPSGSLRPPPPKSPMQNGKLMFWPMASPTMLKADTMQPPPPAAASINPNLYNGGGGGGDVDDSQETPTSLQQILGSEDPLSVAMMLVSTGPNRYTDHNGMAGGGGGGGGGGRTQQVSSRPTTVAINDVPNDDQKIAAPPMRRPSFDWETREQARLKQWSLMTKNGGGSNNGGGNNNGMTTNQIIGGVDDHHNRHHHNHYHQQRPETWSSSSSSSSSEEQQGPSTNNDNSNNNGNNNKMIFDDDGQPELVFTSAEIDNGKMDFKPSSSPSSLSSSSTIREHRNKRPVVMIDQQQDDRQQQATTSGEQEEPSMMMMTGNGNGNRNNNHHNKLGSIEDELIWKTMAQTPDPFDEFYDRDRSFLLPLNNNSLIDYSDIQWKPSASNQMEITASFSASSTTDKNPNHQNNNQNNVTIVDHHQQQQQPQQQADDQQQPRPQQQPQQPRPQLFTELMIMDKGIDSNNNNLKTNGNGNKNKNNGGGGGGWGHPPKLSKLSELLSLNGLFNAIQNQNVKSLNQTTTTSTSTSNTVINNNNNPPHNPNHPHHHPPHHPNLMNDETFFKRQPSSLSLATMLVPSKAAASGGRDVLSLVANHNQYGQKQPKPLLAAGGGGKKPAKTIKTIAAAPAGGGAGGGGGPSHQTSAVTKLMASFSARPLQPTTGISSSLNVDTGDDDDLENNELIHKIGAKFSVSSGGNGGGGGGNVAPISPIQSSLPTSLTNHHHQLHHLGGEEPPLIQPMSGGDLHYDVVQNLMLDHHHHQPAPPSFPSSSLWDTSSMLNNNQQQVALPFLTMEPTTNRIRKNRVLKNMKLLIKAINRIYRIR